MKTWYCFDCGKDLELGECSRTRGAKRHFLALGRCPAGGGPVGVAGASLIVVGLLIAFFAGTVMDTQTPTLGLVYGGGVVGLGLYRLYKQIRARRRSTPPPP